MTPIEVMVLAAEAAGVDELPGWEGRLLAAIHKLGWGLAPFVPEYGVVDGPDSEHAQLLAFRAVAAEMVAVDGSDGLWDARRMIEARNTLWLLFNRPDKVDQTHPAFIPADIEAMGAVMARVARMTVR